MAGMRAEGLAEWRSGWPVVVACAFGITLYAAGYVAAGTFIAPLEKQFGWHRADVASGFIVFALIGALLRPPFGMLLDRWGSRRLAVPGALLTGLVFASFSLLNGSKAQWLALWFALALSSGMVMPSIWGMAVAKNFVASRGRALGGMMLGSASGAIAAPLWSNHLINTYGWRSAYQIMGLSWGVVVALICFFMLRDRRDRPQLAAAPLPKVETSGYSVREGVRSASFIKIVAAIFISNLFNLSFSFHMLPIMTWSGLDRDTGVWILSSLGFSMIAGTMAYGLISDLIAPRVLTAILVSIPTLTCALMLYPTTSPWERMIAVSMFGLSAGAQLPSYINLSTRYYGMRSFGTLSSLAGIATALATAVAPYVAGRIFDQTQSYAIVLIGCIPLLLIASLFLLALGEQPVFEPAAKGLGVEEGVAA